MKKLLYLILTLSLLLCLFLGCREDATAYKIEFMVEGEVYLSISTAGNERVSLPSDPTREGYTFLGWYTEGSTEPFTAESLLNTALTADLRLSAKWEETVHVHTPGDWVVTAEPTCKDEGTRQKICGTCGQTVQTESIAKTEEHTPVTDPFVPPSETEDGRTEGSHCELCGKVLVEQTVIPANLQGVAIKSGALTLEGDTLTGTLSNATETFSFLNDIRVADGARYIVAHDISCSQVLNSKIATLELGDNTFYVLVENGNEMKLYTVTLRRRPTYTVSFVTNGGSSVAGQQVEEGSVIDAPVILRAGYTFTGWSYDFTQPIMGDLRATASWKANTDTPYKIEYYFENANGDGYTLDLALTENRSGTTDTDVIAALKTFPHYTRELDKSTYSGRINGNGTLVLKLYYKRDRHTLSSADPAMGTLSHSGEYKYGQSITVTATPNLGYEFLGWYSGDRLVSDAATCQLTVEEDLTAKFAMKSEMASFEFTSTATTCTVTGVKDRFVSELVVPDYVTYINEGAFLSCKSLVSITLPFVGVSAAATDYQSHFGSIFGGAVNLVYPDRAHYPSEKMNQNYRFSIPETLKSVTVTNCTEIKPSTFRNCDFLESIVLPDTVKKLDTEAFYKCVSLQSVRLGNGVESIGPYAFYQCEKLETVDLPSSLTSIESFAFYQCRSLTALDLPQKLAFVGNCAFTGCSDISELVIPDSVTEMRPSAFSSCTALKRLKIGNGITEIPRAAFSGCEYLSQITFGNKVTSIGSSAFEKCKNLVSIVIPEGIEKIGLGAFEECKRLESVKLPNSLTEIGNYAFQSCTALSEITFGSNLERIGDSAFEHCESLVTVVLPDSVKTVGTNLFRFCYDLLSVTLGNGLTSLDEGAFRVCEKLVEIINNSSVDLTANEYGLEGKEDIHTGSSRLIYQDDFIFYSKDGKNYLLEYIGADTAIILPASFGDGQTYEIAPCAFKGEFQFVSVTLPAAVTAIGDSAFANCPKLVEVINLSSLELTKTSYGLRAREVHTGSSKLVYQGDYTFYTYGGYHFLLEYRGTDRVITLPADYQGGDYEIYMYAFCGNAALQDVTVPDCVTRIGSAAFQGCNALERLEGPFSRLLYYFDASDCYVDRIPSSLKTLVITNVKSIGDHAFQGCVNLESVILSEGIETIGSSSFSGCTGLTEITLPSTVKTIKDYAFRSCVFKSIRIPASVTLIERCAFTGSSLEYAEFENMNGWYRSSLGGSYEGGIYEDELRDPKNAAYYLTARYAEDYWKCN